MRQNDSLLGNFDGVQLGLVASVTQIHRDADIVHPIDDFSAILTHSAVKWLESPVGDTSSEVIAQLRDAQPISKTAIHIIEILELIAALQPKENTELALVFGFPQIRCLVDAHQPLRILRKEAVPLGEKQLGLGKAVRAFAEIDDGNAVALNLRKSASVKAPGWVSHFSLRSF